MNVVRGYVAKGRIAVVVLHDLAFAARWADNIIVMENGRLQNAGLPAAAITPEMLASVYGVDCSVERLWPRILASCCRPVERTAALSGA